MRPKGDFMVADRTNILRGNVIRAEEARLTDAFVQKLGYEFALWLAQKLDTGDFL